MENPAYDYRLSLYASNLPNGVYLVQLSGNHSRVVRYVMAR